MLPGLLRRAPHGKKVWMTATIPGRVRGSSTASAIISRTVSKARRELAEELPVVEEVGTQHLRYREHPLRMRGVGENLLLEKLGEDRGSLGSARGAESPSLAGEGEEVFMGAIITPDAGEALFEGAAVDELFHDLFHHPA